MKKGKKIWYSESWGYPLDVKLPNGNALHLACEFYRGYGWNITDRDTGLISQNKIILNKKQLSEYISATIPIYSRITDSEYYKAQKDKLKQFVEKIQVEQES